MKLRRIILACALAGAVFVAFLPAPAGALPVFARKYGVNCTMCHSTFPRLNDWGQRFRANGYRLPGRENDEKTVLDGPAPFAMRLSAGFTSESFDNLLETVDNQGFRIHGLDILSGGVIAPHVAYLVVFPPQIEGSRGVEQQDGTIEMASVVFSDLGSPWLNLRFGRFEPAYVPFSVKRHLSFTPYEVYDYGAPGGVAFSETQEGVEVTGHGRGFSYAAGYVSGSVTNRSYDTPSDFYGRAAMVIGAGEGQTVGQRIGVTGYYGMARPDSSLSTGGRQPFWRFGADASLNYAHVDLALQYLMGLDPRSLWDLDKDADWSGLFAELTWTPVLDCLAFARYDLVNAPDRVNNKEVARWTGGARYYFADNLALHLEYSHRVTDTPGDGDPIEETVTARLDFGF